MEPNVESHEAAEAGEAHDSWSGLMFCRTVNERLLHTAALQISAYSLSRVERGRRFEVEYLV